MIELINREKDEAEVNTMSPLTWAYIGDGVYELFIRTHLINTTKLKPHMLHMEAIKYVDEVIPEKDWDQKPEDIKKYNIDILTMGSDWEGNPKFEYLKEYCDVRFTKRPFIWSSTAFRKKVDEYAKEMEKEEK